MYPIFVIKFSGVSDLQGSKSPISHWLRWSSLQQCCATAQPVISRKRWIGLRPGDETPRTVHDRITSFFHVTPDASRVNSMHKRLALEIWGLSPQIEEFGGLAPNWSQLWFQSSNFYIIYIWAGITWRHWSREHNTRSCWFPVIGQLTPTVYLARFPQKFGLCHSEDMVLSSFRNVGFKCPFTSQNFEFLRVLTLNFVRYRRDPKRRILGWKRVVQFGRQ